MIDLISNNSGKIAALVAKYEQVGDEIVRYRNFEWQIPAWIVVVLVGAAHLATSELKSLPCSVRIAFILSIIAIWLGGCAHLGYVHWRLTQERKQRHHLEEMLGFYTVGAYVPESSVFLGDSHTRDITFFVGIWHVLSWVGLMTLAGAYSLYAVAVH